jgi:nucleotide-binding universal stress UspA family protein
MSAQTERHVPRIVVGVDGSPSSLSALRWAIRQARLTGGTVDAVIAWQIPAVMSGYGWAPIAVAGGDDYEEAAEKTLEAAISDTAGTDPPPISRVIVHGNAPEALLEASKGADLLVVGSRGHGGFADALLGSVGQHCVHHAHCPVLIMRGEPAQAAA